METMEATAAALEHPVLLEGDQITVRVKTCISGGGAGVPEPCRE